MAHRLERLTAGLSSRRSRLILAIVAAFLAGAVGWRLTRPAPAATSGVVEQSLEVQPRPFASALGVAGTVVPGDSLDVVAPFDGVIQSVAFDYGRPVLAGQVLLTLDPSELQQQLNDAETTYLKAVQAEGEMAAWASGPEVSRARRAAASARADREDVRLKIEETKGLLDRGLVARTEYDALIQQRRGLEMATKAADQDLATTLARGDGANRRMTALALANAQTQLTTLRSQRQAASVRAADSGVIVRPPADKGQSAAPPHAGGRLSRGQLIGIISRSGALAVVFRLNETDANRVREGQAVSVTGAGFPGLVLDGRVAGVAGEAEGSGTGAAGMAAFIATARLAPLSAVQAQQVRIGMSANVMIALYSNPSALVVPPDAVQGAAPSGSVTVRDPRDGRVRTVPVRIGAVAPDGVEILEGLKAGDRVVWATPGPPSEGGK